MSISALLVTIISRLKSIPKAVVSIDELGRACPDIRFTTPPGSRMLFFEPDVLQAPPVIGALSNEVHPLDLGAALSLSRRPISCSRFKGVSDLTIGGVERCLIVLRNTSGPFSGIKNFVMS